MGCNVLKRLGEAVSTQLSAFSRTSAVMFGHHIFPGMQDSSLAPAVPGGCLNPRIYIYTYSCILWNHGGGLSGSGRALETCGRFPKMSGAILASLCMPLSKGKPPLGEAAERVWRRVCY